MRLTLDTDYAPRLLLALAAPRPERVTIADVVRTFGIAPNHLTKVAYDLSSQRLIKTTRGKGGGLALACPPAAINLGMVVLDGYTLADLTTNEIGALLWSAPIKPNRIWPNAAVPGTG